MFKGSPAPRQRPSDPTARSASGRLPRGHRLEQRHSHPGFPPPFGAPPSACSGHLVPPRDSAPLTIGYRALEQPGPRRGVPRSAIRDTTGVGAPSTPRPAVFLTTDSHSPVAACRLFQRPGPITLVLIPSLRARNNEASTGIHSRSPVRSSPRPLLPPDGTEALRLFPTDRTRRRARAGIDLEH